MRAPGIYGVSRIRTGDLLGAIAPNRHSLTLVPLVQAVCRALSSAEFSQFGSTVNRTRLERDVANCIEPLGNDPTASPAKRKTAVREGGGRALSKRPRMWFRPMLVAAGCALLGAGLAAVALADRPQPDPNVAGLQTALAVKGFYRGPIDGLRGPLTTAALRALQRRFRLPSSNLIDRRTRAVLAPLGRPHYRTRALQKGMVGLDVAALQFELRYHGFPSPETGSLNERTLLALKRFQRFADIPPDGVAGNTTYDALSEPPPSPPKLHAPLPLIERAIRVGNAVELVCPYASAVAASIGGTVVFAGDRARGYGYAVITRDAHGLELLYAHLARIDVHDGQQLVAGAMIGLAGWTGKRQPQTSLRLELRLRGAQLNTYAALVGH
jgi:peptidase M23-like protein/putative peptidoglycan binding protein